MRLSLLFASTALLLAACGGADDANDDASHAPASVASTAITPGINAPTAATTASTAGGPAMTGSVPLLAADTQQTDQPAAQASPDFAGMGPLRWDMSVAQMKAAAGAPLYASPADADADACHYLRFDERNFDVALMVENDRFRRVDVRTDAVTAPGGGLVGMSAKALADIYPGHMESRPHKYVQGGQNLVVTPPDNSAARLVFEVGADGNVTAWHIGLPPQVHYVEGCS